MLTQAQIFEAEILYLALKTGKWRVHKCIPDPMFSEEYNEVLKESWWVERIAPPYRSKTNSSWSSRTISDSLLLAEADLSNGIPKFTLEPEIKEAIKDFHATVYL